MDEQPPLGLPAEDWAVTPVSVRVALLSLLPLIPLVERVQQLEAEVADLRAQLNQHSSTSSKPPSSDPPSAPPRPPNLQRGRQRGGQPGHPSHHRPLLPPDDERIQEIIAVPPRQCHHCAALLDPALPDARPPDRRQVWEIPPIPPVVTEYRLRAVACPHCGDVTRATPPPALPPMGYGPRAVAITNLLHARAK
ncbi:MAG: hypothetical protein KatS3mg057_1271 [Herpetosiphonaceae bacterium]|nr:MAG: hypothetical protein KatS3mg057_1271 [Herpetosiphonaceae bacterium]